MGLRTEAENDLSFILEDGVTGFGWPIVVTDPDLNQATLTGFSNDVSNIIDPDTGQAISGRTASVALRISSLIAAGFTTLPRDIASEDSKPWLIAFDDINGKSYTFKVQLSNPDRAIGIVTCILEVYEP